MQKFSADQVRHLAQTANLTLSSAQIKELMEALVDSMALVQQLDFVTQIEVAPTYQVHHLHNVWRVDEVDEKRMFTQKQALVNAKKTYKGFFVVERVIDHEA